MLIVETIAKIRRLSRVQGKSIKAICRELNISRKVVRKVLRSDETEFRYERKHQPYPRMGAWREELDRMLTANVAKPRRERLTLIRIFENLGELGYEGSYSSVWRHAQAWERERGSAAAEAYIPLSFAPGEAYQFDWSHEIVVLDGVTTTVKVAHMRLCHSRMFFVRAYPRETQEMVFDAYDRAFAFFGGACTRGIYDYVPGHVIVVLCPERLCAPQPADPSVVNDVRAHNGQRPASHSRSFGSLCQTGLRGGPTEEVEGT
ncbi:hypothetical protein BFN67_22700 [Pseudaminobacter manganicus]|uniref:Uncharacterized protein n=1 Tax=Manganibacter manganicus TaxID=1873176 RepID=A0A1V8RLN8_9HYPH|nr:hypothetical protein BFN67_22700 [Pseudaminobacter manganicus]